MAEKESTLENDLLREQHDEMLATKPENAEHDAVNCPFCEEGRLSTIDTAIEGGDMSKAYTEDELAAAVAEAVRPVQEELASFKASQEAEEVEARITAAKEAVASEKAEVESKLDVVTAERLQPPSKLRDYRELP